MTLNIKKFHRGKLIKIIIIKYLLINRPGLDKNKLPKLMFRNISINSINLNLLTNIYLNLFWKFTWLNPKSLQVKLKKFKIFQIT